jgi:hypothetical protein
MIFLFFMNNNLLEEAAKLLYAKSIETKQRSC